MDKDAIIQETIQFVKTTLKDAEGGHDWWHIYRVWRLAKHIATAEQVTNSKIDLLVIELGALLHDIADSKFYGGDEDIGPKKARDFLSSIAVEPSIIDHVENIIRNVSFKQSFDGGKSAQSFRSAELNIIQDADRLDALGAIGIARTFSLGGHKGNSIYNPEIKPNLHMSKEEYKRCDSSTINHFYEKLLLLKGLMNTKTGKAIAEHRHLYMEQYLAEFHKEWDGEY